MTTITTYTAAEAERLILDGKAKEPMLVTGSLYLRGTPITALPDNPTAAEGPADEDRGEAHVEYDDKPAWFDHVAKIRAGLAAAKTKTYVAEINAEYEKSRAALPDDVVAELDGLVTAARKRVQNAEV